MYLKPKYVNMILLAPFVMALASLFFVVSGWMPFYCLSILLVFFVGVIYAVDLFVFGKALVESKLSTYIARIPYITSKSLLGSIATAVLYLLSVPSLMNMSNKFIDIFIIIVSVGVIFTVAVKVYKLFIASKSYENDYEDDAYEEDYNDEHDK